MLRSLRFEYAGAVYHVNNRGKYCNRSFEKEGSKDSYQKCLLDTCECTNGWISEQLKMGATSAVSRTVASKGRKEKIGPAMLREADVKD